MLYALCFAIASQSHAASPIPTTGIVGSNVAPTARPSMIASQIASTRMPTLRLTQTAYTPINPVNPASCENPAPEQTTISRCVPRYLNCLRQDTVCGEHFELCTDTKTYKDFNRAKILCQDILATCPAEAIKSIFGVTNMTITEQTANCDGIITVIKRTFNPALETLRPQGDENSLYRDMVAGAEWAARNAVQTCKNVADRCIRVSCEKDPHKCFPRTFNSYADAVDIVNLHLSSQSRKRISPEIVANYIDNMAWDDQNVKGYIRGQCREEVGGNPLCFMVANPGKTAKNTDLVDEVEMNLTFQEIFYGSTGGRWNANQSRIKEWLALAIEKSLIDCKGVAKNCVKSACGSGSLAACYGAAIDMSDKNAPIRIETGKLADKIEAMCAPQVNATQSCKDLFPESEDMWEKVWGTRSGTTFTDGGLGLAAELNMELASMFSEGTVKKLRMECQNAAEDCVRKQCGRDFEYCFVNGTLNHGITQGTILDGVFSGAFAGGFSKDMARGLCMIPVKKIPACQDYFDIQYAKMSDYESGDSWGTGASLRNAWQGQQNLSTNQPLICTVTTTYTTTIQKEPRVDIVTGEPMKDSDGNFIFDDISLGTYGHANKKCEQQEQNIFNQLISEISETAQQVMITRQNRVKETCRARNNRGGTFTWAKAPVSRPRDYDRRGFAKSQPETPDLWGAFCQMKINVHLGDSLQNRLITTGFDNSKCITEYFVDKTDVRMCGETIDTNCLNQIATQIRTNAKIKPGDEVKESFCVKHPGFCSILVGTVATGGGMAAGGALGNTFQRMGAQNKGCTQSGTCSSNANQINQVYLDTNKKIVMVTQTKATLIPATQIDDPQNPGQKTNVPATMQTNNWSTCMKEVEDAMNNSVCKDDRNKIFQPSAAGGVGAGLGGLIAGGFTMWGMGARLDDRRKEIKEENATLLRIAQEEDVVAYMTEMENEITCTACGNTFNFRDPIICD